MENDGLNVLLERIDRQRMLLEQWRRPVEPLLFETLRAIDYVFCQELFYSENSPRRLGLPQYFLSTWGVNKALARTIPDHLGQGPFRLFPSTSQTQRQADDFLLQCGILEKAELLHGWIAEGLVSPRLDTPAHPLRSGIRRILVLKSNHPSLFHEVVSRTHREWMSDLTREFDKEWEKRLEQRHFEILPELASHVQVLGGWGIAYSSTDAIDQYFLEWGQVYLRRMWSQDLVSPDDKIGGAEFRDYLGVLAALAGRAQKHLCFASILMQRHPELDLRNLLTTFSPYDEFVALLARHLDADASQIQSLLGSLTLEPQNRDIHTATTDTAWAPIVRATHNSCILPLYGLEINPFLFLLKDLQEKYPKDWSLAANNREKRWLLDLKAIFPPSRWNVRDRSLAIRDGAKIVTDIDFLAYDSRDNELAVFQLKWQHPVGTDNRARRSSGRNLVTEGNRWIDSVHRWLDKFGLEELSNRAGIAIRPGAHLELFVVARYNAFFSGFANHDKRAVWADWNHLLRVRLENRQASVRDLAGILNAQVEAVASSFPGESYAIPLLDLAIVLNPSSEPPRAF